MIKETEKINVLNYNENRVSVAVAPNKAYSFEPSPDGIVPTVIPMTIDEIKYANNYNAFRNGMLFFDEEKQEDVYYALNITNWQDILRNSDIKEIILHPTYDGLMKIVSIKDSSMFERVRGVFQKLQVENVYDISVRVAQIIDTRYKELLNRKIDTAIQLTKKDIPDTVSTAELDQLKEQNSTLQTQVEEMQKQIELLLKEKNNNDTSSSQTTKSKTSTAKKTAATAKQTT